MSGYLCCVGARLLSSVTYQESGGRAGGGKKGRDLEGREPVL